jgi:hypothetical protein
MVSTALNGLHAEVRTLSKHERRDEVQAGLREAEEEKYLNDCRQCTREPLRSTVNTPPTMPSVSRRHAPSRGSPG